MYESVCESVFNNNYKLLTCQQIKKIMKKKTKCEKEKKNYLNVIQTMFYSCTHMHTLTYSHTYGINKVFMHNIE